MQNLRPVEGLHLTEAGLIPSAGAAIRMDMPSIEECPASPGPQCRPDAGSLSPSGALAKKIVHPCLKWKGGCKYPYG